MILTLLKMQLIILEANVFLFPLMFSYIKKNILYKVQKMIIWLWKILFMK